MALKEKIINNLLKYNYINKYFGKAIRNRLEIEGYTRGMLTAHLLDEESKTDLEKLEHVLELGEKYCAGFERIFKERHLPNKDFAIDGEIINTLAEVKAFEFLHNYGLSNISKMKRKIDAKTVDFTAKKDGQRYAIEVTRLGIAQADRKKPIYLVKDKLPAHNLPGVRNLVGEFFLISGKDNIQRIIETINDTVENKYRQIKEFCQIQDSSTKGVIFISSGRDYFVMNKYAKTEFEMHPNTVKEALEKVWYTLKEESSDYEYLHHVVITVGKDLGKTIIFPDFKGTSS